MTPIFDQLWEEMFGEVKQYVSTKIPGGVRIEIKLRQARKPRYTLEPGPRSQARRTEYERVR